MSVPALYRSCPYCNRTLPRRSMKWWLAWRLLELGIPETERLRIARVLFPEDGLPAGEVPGHHPAPDRSPAAHHARPAGDSA